VLPALTLAILGAVVAGPTALAGSALSVSPTNVKFKQPFGTSAEQTVTVTNKSPRPLDVRLTAVHAPDPLTYFFEGPSACEPGPNGDFVLAGGQSCVVLIRFFATSQFARTTDTLVATATDAQTGEAAGSRSVKIDARGFEPTLRQLIDLGDRELIRTWAAERSIATLNTEVAALGTRRRARLAEVVLDTNATGAARDQLLRAMRTILADGDLGFYAEIWSYTFIELVPGGLFGGCNHLFLDPSGFGGLSDHDARNVLAHESLHSFDCVNGGPVGSLDEGAAIWIYKTAFDEVLPGESWAEATYGTKLFYRDINGNPDFPLGAPLQPTPKLLELFRWLSDRDPSRLPWNSTERLVTCFARHFAALDRNVDFFAVWLPAVQDATAQMLADPDCRPV
jgi:hypothetical protein